MKHRLNYSKEDPNYLLLDEIFKITGSRKSRTIIASKGVKNIENDDFINTVWMEYLGVLLAVPGHYHRNNNYNRSYLQSQKVMDLN